MNRTRDRLTGATIAVLLQAGFIVIFIYSLPLIVPVKKLPHEIAFFLPPLREAVKPDSRSRRGRPSPSPPAATPPLAAPPIATPRIVMPPGAPPSATDLQGFGNALFGCAPENLNNLTPEQRSHCSGLAAIPRDKGGIAEPRSLVKDLPRREAELAARNTPARVPCANLRTKALGPDFQDTGIMTDPLCALNGWINGFGGLPP